MAGGTHAGGLNEVNWVEKYIDRLSEDMKDIRGMETRMNGRFDELNNRMNEMNDGLNNRMNEMNNRMNEMRDGLNNKIDENSRHINNLVLAMVVGVGFAIVSAVISLSALLK